MSGDKKTHPDTAIPGWAKMGAETGQDATSTANNTTPIPSGQAVRVADLLSHGQDTTITRHDLENMTGLDGRTLRGVIQQARLNGTPILSDCRHGYYLPDDEVEAERFVKSMRRRASEILKVARAVEKAMRLD